MVNTVTPNGETIRTRRTRAGLSQEGLAEIASLSKGTIANAEASKDISPGTLSLIARALEVSPSALLFPVNDTGAQLTVVNSPAEKAPGGSYPDFHVFGFGERDSAFAAVLKLPAELGLTRARVIAFTSHTIEQLPIQLFNAGIKYVDIFIGCKRQARLIESSRQEDLLDDLWRKEATDLR